MFMRIILATCLLAAFAAAGPLTMTYTGSPCITGDSGFQTGITGTGGQTVVATALANYNPPGIGSLPASSCIVTASDELITSETGNGFLTFSLSGDAESDPSFYINGIYEGGCSGFGCNPASGIIPVTLGIPFDISVEAIALYNPVGCCTSSNLIQATIRVYGVVDTCPGALFGPCNVRVDQTISDFVATPEPGAGLLLFFGLAVMGVCIRALRADDTAREVSPTAER